MPQSLRPLLSLRIFLHTSPFPEFNIQSGTVRETEVFFFDVLHFVCLFILGCAGSWVLHTSVRPDAACGLLALVGSHAVERSREGEGFRLSAHQLRCCTARGILQDQGSVSCPQLRQVASYPLCPQGSLM